VARSALAPVDSIRAPAPALAVEVTSAAFNLETAIERLIWQRYAPAALVVDAGLQVLHFDGNDGRYLAPARGAATLHVLKLVPAEAPIPTTGNRGLEVAPENFPRTFTRPFARGAGDFAGRLSFFVMWSSAARPFLAASGVQSSSGTWARFGRAWAESPPRYRRLLINSAMVLTPRI
jgi:hypothetical protein